MFGAQRSSLRRMKDVSDLTKKGKEMEPSRIRAIDLLDRFQRGEETVLIDTRNPKAWAESDQKLSGALRIPANEIEAAYSQTTARSIDR